MPHEDNNSREIAEELGFTIEESSYFLDLVVRYLDQVTLGLFAKGCADSPTMVLYYGKKRMEAQSEYSRLLYAAPEKVRRAMFSYIARLIQLSLSNNS